MDTAGGILVLLALGLTFRLIIAYLLPGSGFKVDLGAFQFWANAVKYACGNARWSPHQIE